MLENQPWIRFSNEMQIEWEQCLCEGKDVEKFKPLCAEIAKLEGYQEGIALEVEKILHNAPMREDFAFDEPSDLDGILKARSGESRDYPSVMNDTERKDKLTGAWIGRIAGCLLGKPVEGYRRDRLLPLFKETDNYPVHKYICKRDFNDELVKRLDIDTKACWADNLSGYMPVDDDTNYTVFSMKLVDVYGKDFRPNDVLEAWLGWIPMLPTCTAERVAYRNAAAGLLAPQTATYKNPYREWIGAQIRGDFFGYINMGNPKLAAEMAWRDASISHIKNGIYGEMFISAMIAVAAVCDDVLQVVEAGLNEIPKNCRLRRDIDLVLGWYKNGLSAEEVIEKIHKAYDERTSHGWCFTNPNAMIVVMALIYGGKDLGKSICLAVQAAFDTDCNGASAGSIVGIMIGASQIGTYWTDAFNKKLKTTIDGYEMVSIDDLVAGTMAIMKRES